MDVRFADRKLERLEVDEYYTAGFGTEVVRRFRKVLAVVRAAVDEPIGTINEMINGKKRMTAQTAKAVGLALGTGPELWLDLQTAFDLFHAPDPDPAIARRARSLANA